MTECGCGGVPAGFGRQGRPWWIDGDPERLPWTGRYDLSSLKEQVEEFYRFVDHVSVEDMQIFRVPGECAAIVKTICQIHHARTGARMKLKTFMEFELSGSQLRAMDASFDGEAVAFFLENGVAPRRRACQAVQNAGRQVFARDR